MKLFIKETCVVKGGAVVTRGETYDTGVSDKKQDGEAFQLISTGRAVALSDTDAVDKAKGEIAAEAASKKKEK